MDEDSEKMTSGKEAKIAALQPYMWKKGQSGNPAGRPKGKTMKEWAKEYLERMTDEERDAFLEGISKEIIWKMAEGNAHSTEDHKVEVTLPTPIAPINRDIHTDNSVSEDSSTK